MKNYLSLEMVMDNTLLDYWNMYSNNQLFKDHIIDFLFNEESEVTRDQLFEELIESTECFLSCEDYL